MLAEGFQVCILNGFNCQHVLKDEVVVIAKRSEERSEEKTATNRVVGGARDLDALQHGALDS